jgi:hypothetical protein
MPRPVFVIPFLAFALQASQAQLFSHGAPASVVSPTADGRQHGVPASVVSPTQLPFGVHPQRSIRVQGPLRRFGNPHSPRRQTFVPIPVFYSYYYGEGGDPSAADPYVPEASTDTTAAAKQQASSGGSDDELRAAYLQGARDALSRQADSRYGEHYTDSRERGRQQPAQEERKSDKRSKPSDSEAQAPAPVDDKTPATVFIFKDGHQLETKNYAIMGGTLFDFSSKMLRKIQMDEIDSAATLKANDDRGVTMKLQ